MAVVLVPDTLKPHGWIALVLAFLCAGLFLVYIFIVYAGSSWFYNYLVKLDAQAGFALVLQGRLSGKWKVAPSSGGVSFVAFVFTFISTLFSAGIRGKLIHNDVSLVDVTIDSVKEYSQPNEQQTYYDLSRSEQTEWEMSHPNVFEYYVRVARRKFRIEVWEYNNINEGDLVHIHFMPCFGTVLQVRNLSQQRLKDY